MSFGFGANNNSSGGFGGGGFGSNTNTTSSGSVFGGSNTATAGGSGFGGGFGSTANKPAFGSTATTSGGSLFGGNTSTSGGFGSNTSNTQSSAFGGFGNSNTGGGAFGAQNKPAGGFGSSGTGGGLFGNTSNTGGGFGASTANNTTNNNNSSSNLFGGGAGGFGGGGNAFGSNTNTQQTAPTAGFGGFSGSSSGGFGAGQGTNNGTAGTPFQPFQEKDSATNANSHYQSITFQQPYQSKSFEELRCEDYAQGRRFGNTNGQAGAFGQSTGFGSNTGGFGSTSTNPTTSGGGLFGGNNAATSGGSFGGFGANNTAAQNKTGLGGFGASNTGGGLFGQSSSASTTGGFGATSGSGGGLFGNNQSNTTSGFGASNTNTGGGLFGQNNNQQSGTGFGASNTSGGLFGQNNAQAKPAFGGFGANNTPANTSGGLFGSNNQQSTAGGFGASNTNTGGSLFGNNNQQAQNKPAFGGFGASNTTGGFGSNNANPGGSLFGGNNQQQQPQQQNSNPFGGNNNNASGSLFGNNTQNNASGGLFGNKPSTGGSLFGGNNANTTNTGGSLFGNNNNANTNPGGSLFGGNNNNNTGSIFGNNNQNKPASGSLFGGSTQNTNPGGSLFGGLGQNNGQQNNASNSLFGNSNNQNQQNQSLFGNSMGSNQAPQQNALTASLTSAPWGNEQLFSSLAAPSPPVGPLATPLQGAKPVARKTQSLLASSRLGSPAYSTPRAVGSFGRSGYGFSYSAYGTPSSVSSFSGSLTPGAQSLLRPTGSLGSGLSQRLGLSKSASMNNLRGDGENTRPSLLNATPNSASVRRLKIDRNLRTDLFTPSSSLATPPASQNDADGVASGPGPSGLKKTVSFDRSAEKAASQPSESSASGQESSATPNASNALVPTETPDDEPQTNGSLSTVHEDVTPQPKKSTAASDFQTPPPGDYWTEPPIKTLKQMGRQQLEKIGKFVVGRQNVGKIEFSHPDLSQVDLDNLFDKIIILAGAHATVYPDNTVKPRQGTGLNVPSKIWLRSVWPKKHKNAEALKGDNIPKAVLDKHLRVLKKVNGTHFISYDPKIGEWNFSVQHYTTYGLDDDADESTMDQPTEVDGSSSLSDAPDTPGDMLVDDEMTAQSFETRTSPEGPEEDTFQFRLERSRLSQSGRSAVRSPAVPGGFENETEGNVSYDYDDPSADEAMEADGEAHGQDVMSTGLIDMEDPFMEPSVVGGAVQIPSPGAMDRYHSSLMDEDELEPAQEEEPDIPGSFRREQAPPKSILKPSIAPPMFDEAWEDKLQRTLSPKKQARNRQELRDLQTSALKFNRDDKPSTESPFKKSLFSHGAMDQSKFGESHLVTKSAARSKLGQATTSTNDFGKSKAFKTSMDIMNSLWAQEKSDLRRKGAEKYSYPNKRVRNAPPDVPAEDAEVLATVKPSFTADGTFLYQASSTAAKPCDGIVTSLEPLIGEHKDVRFVKFAPPADVNPVVLAAQKEATTLKDVGEMPQAFPPSDACFADIASCVTGKTEMELHENNIWSLCSILFDDMNVVGKDVVDSLSSEEVDSLAKRIRLDALRTFWAKIVAPTAEDQIKHAKSPEEKALLLLTVNDTVGACEALVAGKDFKLATMISQLPIPSDTQEVMARQIAAWRDRNDWSEMSEPVRALYAILAGEYCTLEGNQDVPAEDRASTFNIAKRFGISWQQSFALRLFCGSYESIEDVVKAYCTDIASGRESVKPRAAWPTASGEDTLMQLLRLATGPSDTASSSAELLGSTTVSGSSTDSRLAWQMATLLQSTGSLDVPSDIIDRLTLDFATELEGAGFFVSGAWLLLHLSNTSERQMAVQTLLNRNSAAIPYPAQDGADHTDFDVLVQENGVPEALVWVAKALAAASVDRNQYLQTEYLLNAAASGLPQTVEEAHALLCGSVGPQAIIERDYASLTDLLAHFDRAMGNGRADGWEHGGQVYADFCSLMQMSARDKQGRKGAGLLQRLPRELAQMEEMRGAGSGLLERVARIEMKKVVGEVVKEHENDGNTAQLPSDDGAKGMEGAAMWQGYKQALGMVV